MTTDDNSEEKDYFDYPGTSIFLETGTSDHLVPRETPFRPGTFPDWYQIADALTEVVVQHIDAPASRSFPDLGLSRCSRHLLKSRLAEEQPQRLDNLTA